MSKLSTQSTHGSNIRDGKTLYPSKQTLDFLVRFARAYKAEPLLHPGICSYLLN